MVWVWIKIIIPGKKKKMRERLQECKCFYFFVINHCFQLALHIITIFHIFSSTRFLYSVWIWPPIKTMHNKWRKKKDLLSIFFSFTLLLFLMHHIVSCWNIFNPELETFILVSDTKPFTEFIANHNNNSFWGWTSKTS